MTRPPAKTPGAANGQTSGSWLRLYIAGGTPNSARAEQNLKAALYQLDGTADRLNVKIIDVFKEPKRALTDGVIVTPTLIGGGQTGRAVIIGDLTDTSKLAHLLQTLVTDS